MQEQLIKVLRSGEQVVFDWGKFDRYCVYIKHPDGSRKPPFDADYFARLQAIAPRYAPGRVYADFVRIYDNTTQHISPAVLEQISAIADSYLDGDKLEVERWFTVIYAGMIAEENREHAVLKKRIKRLGMHQVLMEKMEPTLAASFSRGKPWRMLDALMRQRGF